MEDLLAAVEIGDEDEVLRVLDDHPALLRRVKVAGTANNPLTVAAEHGQLGMVDLLLDSGEFKIDTTGRCGMTPLAWAAKGGHGEMVAFLLSEGAQADSKDNDGTTPVMHASKNGHLGVVRLLVHYMDAEGLEAMDWVHRTALHYAAEGGHEEIVAFLFSKGAELNKCDRQKRTPLLTAASQGHLRVMWTILELPWGRGAGIALTDWTKRAVLHYAAVWGFEELVTYLLHHGAQADARDSSDMTPLMLAAWNGHLDVVRHLLQHLEGQGLEALDERRRTALHHAALNGYGEVVDFLLSKGAQAHTRDDEGMTPLSHAAMGGYAGVVLSLFPHLSAQEVDERDEEGATALDCAAGGGHEEIVRFLLGKGARADNCGLFGTTTLMQAACGGAKGAVALVLEHTEGKGVNDRGVSGRTALDCAARSGHADVVALLLGHGAVVNGDEEVGKMPLLEAASAGHFRVVQVLLQHLGAQGVQQHRDGGWNALHCASVGGHGEVVRLLLLNGADPRLPTTNGQRPRELAARGLSTDMEVDLDLDDEDFEPSKGHPECVAVFDWWDGELERRAILYRATCLHRAHTTQRDKPTSRVPIYLEARAAAGHALPTFEVVSPQPQEQEGEEGQEGANGKRKAADQAGDLSGGQAEEDEMHAMLEYVVKELNEALMTELLEGFHA